MQKHTNTPPVLRRTPPSSFQDGLIGSALRNCDKVGNALRTDPHPEIPFASDLHTPSARIAVICVFLASALITLAALVS